MADHEKPTRGLECDTCGSTAMIVPSPNNANLYLVQCLLHSEHVRSANAEDYHLSTQISPDDFDDDELQTEFSATTSDAGFTVDAD